MGSTRAMGIAGRGGAIATAVSALLMASAFRVPGVDAAASRTVDITEGGVTYAGATSEPCLSCTLSVTGRSVRLWPTGSATFTVTDTSSVSMNAFGGGRTYAVSVDQGPPSQLATSSCACWETLTVAAGLSGGSHHIQVTNTSPPGLDQNGPIDGLDIQAWIVDRGGTVAHGSLSLASPDPAVAYSAVTFVPDPKADSGTLAAVPAGGSLSVVLRQTATLRLEVVGTGATLRARQNDRLVGAQIALPADRAYRTFVPADWGMPPGMTKVSVDVVSGTLELDRLVATSPPGFAPAAIDPAALHTVPALAAFGDSIAFGSYSLGNDASSDGYADRLASLRGIRLANVSFGGTSATCYGQAHTAQVVDADPALAIVAFGVNDLRGDLFGCHPTIDQFRQAYDAMLGALRSGLPGVPIFAQSILPTPLVAEDTRRTWNRVIRDVAGAHGMAYVRPGEALDPTVDLADALHPNNRGAAVLAAVWDSALPLGTADLHARDSADPTSVAAGQPATFTLTVRNRGPDRAPGATLVDTLPAGANLISVTPSAGSCAGTATVTCLLGPLDPGARATVKIVVSFSGSGRMADSAVAASRRIDPDRGDDAASATVTVTP